ncbi:MAG: NAD(P)/FAD-dependent oxidoreductase [Treponema sp.]|jgi:2-enoate reductase|nr:NAD(P)/FAD-dependent oxidoreductase [Treponema sp.]
MVKTDPVVQKWVDRYGDWFLEKDGEGSFTRLLKNARMTKKLHPYTKLFSPIQINGLTLKNRIIMAPIGNISMGDETGRPSEKMLQYFYERARGGAALITTGLVPVSHGIDNSITEPGELSYFPRIDRSRSVFAGWRDLAQGIHAFGSRIFIQLTPGLGRVGNPQCLLTKHRLPNSASWNPSFYIPQIPCAPLSGGSLRKIIRSMGQAAADAKTAGIDGVYLHGHEGYLLEQMTNGAFNRRILGRYAHKEAFGIDCVREIRKRTSPDFPVMYRIDLSLALNETYGEGMKTTGSLKKFVHGRTVTQTLEYMHNLVRAGVDIFDVDLGCYDNWWLPHPPASMPPGCFLEVSALVKNYFEERNILSNRGFPVPVAAVGKLGYPDLAEGALREGKADAIMLGRPLLADPQWPNKAYAGRVDEICPCIGCQEGCLNEFIEGGHPQCAVNPRSSFEHVFSALPAQAARKKKVAVVGAGPAGIICAVTAAKRGHQVTLFEKGTSPGGKLLPGGVAKIKYEAENYRIYLEGLLKRAVTESKLAYKPKTELDLKGLKKLKAGVIVFAQGSRDTEPSVPGIGDALRAVDLLANPKLLEEAKTVAVIGGGTVGCETAYWLRYEKNCAVTVVEMDKYMMNHACTANRGHLIHYLKKGGVSFLNCTRLTRVTKKGVEVVRNISKTVPDPGVTWHPILPENVVNPLAVRLKLEESPQTIPADLVVIAAGGTPDNALYREALEALAAPELYNIGDSFSPGRVLEAVRSGYRLALDL